jgi:sugar transferase EpsL
MPEVQSPQETSQATGLTIPRQARRSAGLRLADKQARGAVATTVGKTEKERDQAARRYIGKRLLDAFLLLLVAIPVLIVGIISAVAILIDDGFPVLFRQVRSGRDGRPFVLLKLRTMTNADRRQDAFPSPTDFTRTGRILRRASIDELPQLINVLRGDMSIVGPRPTLPYQVERYDSRQRRRLCVKPGLTGLAQVRGRNRVTWAERIEWDLEYVANQSLWLDLRVLVGTAKVVLSGDGVSGHPHRDPIARIEQGGAN